MAHAEPDNLTIRAMTRADLDAAIDWAAAEGWNPGLDDAECFYAADPAGFLMGFAGDAPVASISVVRYGDTFGFLGLYIVRPESAWTGLRLSALAGRDGASEGPRRGPRRGRSRSRRTMRAPASRWRIATCASAARRRSMRPTTRGMRPVDAGPRRGRARL